jgi:hypothetical protein
MTVHSYCSKQISQSIERGSLDLEVLLSEVNQPKQTAPGQNWLVKSQSSVTEQASNRVTLFETQ